MFKLHSFLAPVFGGTALGGPAFDNGLAGTCDVSTPFFTNFAVLRRFDGDPNVGDSCSSASSESAKVRRLRLEGVVGTVLRGESKNGNFSGDFLDGECIGEDVGVNGEVGDKGIREDEAIIFALTGAWTSGRIALSFRAYVRFTVGERNGVKSPRLFPGLRPILFLAFVGVFVGVMSIGLSVSESVRSESSSSVWSAMPPDSSGCRRGDESASCSATFADAFVAAALLGAVLLIGVDKGLWGDMVERSRRKQIA